MFRTRDFILVFTTVVFLVMAIGTTVIYKYESPTDSDQILQFSDANSTDFIAEEYVPEKLSREDRLEYIRLKIAESGTVTISSPEVHPEPNIVTKEEEILILGEVQLCSEYLPYTGNWPTQGVQFEVVEGARIVYTESVIDVPPVASTSSSTQQSSVVRNTLIELSAYPFVASSQSCLTSDVVGVAQDGSLIRNSESELYGVFGSQTLIGYALDGHPIFGTSESSTDECGGAVVGAQYRYYLSSESKNILHCFSSVPVPFTSSLSR
jgi:hypothetical protein